MEVTRKNFYDVYLSVEKHLKDPDFCFVAFDLEFGGKDPSPSLRDVCFDTEQLRHLKKRKTAQMFDVYQVGLTFVFLAPEDWSFECKTYNFNLLKDVNKSNCIVRLDNCCAQFMANSGVDFNLIFTEGIPYMNKQEHESMQKEIELSKKNKIELPKDNLYFDELCKKVEDHFADEEKAKNKIIEITPKNDYYIKAIIQRFDNKLSATGVKIKTIKLKNDKNQKVVKFFSAHNLQLFKMVKIDEAGFGAIINLLLNHETPMIGFSCMLDLYYLYEKFISTIQEDINDFKKTLHEKFPIVYDVAYIVRNRDLKDLFKSKSLQAVSETILASEFIKFQKNVKKDDGIKKTHTAGYDSYLTALSMLWILWKRNVKYKDVAKMSSQNMLYNFRGPSFSIIPRDYSPIKRKTTVVFFIVINLRKFTRNQIIGIFEDLKVVKFVPNGKQSCFVEVEDNLDEGKIELFKQGWLLYISNKLFEEIKCNPYSYKIQEETVIGLDKNRFCIEVNNTMIEKFYLWPDGKQHIIDELNKIDV